MDASETDDRRRTIDDGRRTIDEEHFAYSYEHFASNPRIRGVDAALARLAEPGHTVLDLATGTGAMLEHLQAERKLLSPFTFVGVDIDERALQIAESKSGGLARSAQDEIRFIKGSAESVPFVARDSQDIVICANAIHLMDACRVAQQAYAALKPGKIWLVSTAYARDIAYPGSTLRALGMLVRLTQRYLEEEAGITDIPSPVNLLHHTVEDYKRAAQQAGFEHIETHTYTVDADRQTVEAICRYEEFVHGALPGVPTQLAVTALLRTIDEMYKRSRIDTFQRTWLFMVAQK